METLPSRIGGGLSALLVAASVLVATENAIYAESSGNEVGIQFDIPSQALEAALEAYGATSRLQVLYETALTSGKRSAEVKGIYTQEGALRLLLSGTGLDFNYTEDRAFTLVPARPRWPVGQDRQIADFNLFLGGIQAQIMASLCRRPETRPGEFRLAMQFWIGGSGQIENPNLLSSTGAVSRDAAITNALARITFGQAPPVDMPQPITIVLRAGPPSGEDECIRTK